MSRLAKESIEMIRKSTAVWRGDGPNGSGTLNAFSGAFTDLPYSAKLRFENEDGRAGTNPEELIGAAHAGCFSMALAFALTRAGHTPEELKVEARVDLQKGETGFSIVGIELVLEAKIPGLAEDELQTFAENAKKGCPVSRALAATPITLSAKLV